MLRDIKCIMYFKRILVVQTECNSTENYEVTYVLTIFRKILYHDLVQPSETRRDPSVTA
jgi:hypothetical protein